MTKQEIFNKVWEHAKLLRGTIGQCSKVRDNSSENDMVCQYRMEKDGVRYSCFVGCLIPDEIYSHRMEDKAIDEIMESSLPPFRKIKEFLGTDNKFFIEKLQGIHDDSFPEEWETSLRWRAIEEGLEIPS